MNERKVWVLYNEAWPHALVSGYEEGDVLFPIGPVLIARMDDESQDDVRFAEDVWAMFNRDDRPHRTSIRSMSKGDVVWFPDNGKAYAVGMIGFEELSDTWGPVPNALLSLPEFHEHSRG